MARVVAFVPDLLFGSTVVGALTAAGHEPALVSDGDALRRELPERAGADRRPDVRRARADRAGAPTRPAGVPDARVLLARRDRRARPQAQGGLRPGRAALADGARGRGARRPGCSPPSPGKPTPGTPLRRIHPPHAPPRHVQSQPHAVAVANLPLLLQVLRVRDPPAASARARRGAEDPRPRGWAPSGQGAAGAYRREAGGQRRRRRQAGRVRPRGLHVIRGLDVRARARAWPAAAHQPRRPQPRGAGPPARGHRLAGPDARVRLRAADGDRARGLADQASRTPDRHDRRRRRAEDPVHERDPGRDRRDRGGAGRLAGGDRRAAPPTRSRPGGDPPELRPAPELLRARAGRDRRRRRAGVLADGRRRRPAARRAEVGLRGDDRGHEAADRRGPPADARRRHPGAAEPVGLVGRASAGGRHRPRRAQRQRRPHLARAPVPVARPGPRQASGRGPRAHRAAVRVPRVHRPRVGRPAGARRDQEPLLVVHPAPWLGPPRRGVGRPTTPRRARSSTPATAGR